MKNTYINNYRRRINLIITDGFEGLPKLNQIESVVSLDPASMLESKQLEKIVESIDERLKIPFKMKNEGFKYKEIAEKLDIKLGTVKSRIFIARKTLMKHLNENIMVFE
jgi:RNA polymerase sigma-70 factor (ECF subfamily)